MRVCALVCLCAWRVGRICVVWCVCVFAPCVRVRVRWQREIAAVHTFVHLLCVVVCPNARSSGTNKDAVTCAGGRVLPQRLLRLSWAHHRPFARADLGCQGRRRRRHRVGLAPRRLCSPPGRIPLMLKPPSIFRLRVHHRLDWPRRHHHQRRPLTRLQMRVRAVSAAAAGVIAACVGVKACPLIL